MSVVHGPLHGVTVVALGGIGPVPFAAGLFADLGATVIRIERPDGHSGVARPLTRLGLGNALILELDLKSDGGAGIARTLVRHADVLVEGYRPGVLERLGFAAEVVLEENPRLVLTRITGWGQDGPYAGMAGHDINYLGLSGVLAAIGSEEPVPPLNLIGDYAGGALYAVIGTLSLLIAREGTGRGGVVDAAMVDGSASLLAPIRELLNAGLWVERRASNLLDGGAPFYRTYRTSDGQAMAVGAIEPEFYRQLLVGLELAEGDLPDRHDPSNWPELSARFADAFAMRSRDDWQRVFDGTDACVTPVLTMGEVGDHPHNEARTALLDDDGGTVPAPSPRMRGVEGGRRAQRAVSDTLVSLGIAEEVARDLEDTAASYWV